MKTETNNSIVAEFMQWQHKNPLDKHSRYLDINFTDDFLYHIEWNWLFPVIDKIEELGHRFTIGTTFIEVYTDKYEQYHCGVFNGKLNCTFHAVVEFIKWYNKQANRHT